VSSPRTLPLAPSSPDLTSDWRAQVRNAITSLASLEQHFVLTEAEREGARRAEAAGFPMSITPYYASLADKHDASCPIRLQCVPTALESVEVPGDLRDPLGEEDHTVAPHLVSRYPDRALLLVTDRCSVYCRFCTRSRMVGQDGGARPLSELDAAFTWLSENKQITDVIVSGGDPLVMTDARIEAILERLRALTHLDTIRIATRTPVTLPQRIDTSLAKLLRGTSSEGPATWVMTHFNHPKELSPESTRALACLVDQGIPVMNQCVLLRGINDSTETLSTLFRALVKRRVRPYYLLQADVVRGTGHLRTPLDTGLRIMSELQGRLSGIALPKFIVDTPRGMGKVPMQADALVRSEDGVHTLRTWRGVDVDYIDPPR
jgi:lysine 2,3-aminomutase